MPAASNRESNALQIIYTNLSVLKSRCEIFACNTCMKTALSGIDDVGDPMVGTLVVPSLGQSAGVSQTDNATLLFSH
jgi:hypothetical protein